MKKKNRCESDVKSDPVPYDAAAKAIFDVVTRSIDDPDAVVIGRVKAMLQTYYPQPAATER